MKTYPYNLALGLFCAGALASCASKPEPVKMQVSASLRSDSSPSGKVFQEVNSYRRSIGKQDLQRHPGLDKLAQDHCEYLRKHRGEFSLYGANVSHIGFEGRVAVARARYQMSNMSENVASANHPGQAPAPILVSLWKGSKGHHKNMSDDWTHTGVGLVTDSDGTVFSSQLFGVVNCSQMSSRERFTRH